MSCLCNIPSNSFGERLNVKTLDQVWLDGGDMTAHSKVYIYILLINTTSMCLELVVKGVQR